MVFQGRCCYEYVIQLTHLKIPVLLCHSGQSLSHQTLKSGRCVAQDEGRPLPLVQPQLTRESCLFSILLPQRDLTEGRTQVQCGELGITKFTEAHVYSRYRARIFYRYRVQVAKVAKNLSCPFFFAITTPQAHGNFEGCIMSYSSNISISARHASDLCGVIRPAPSLWGTAPSSSSISRSDLKPPVVARNLSCLFSLLSVLSLAKPVCQTLVHMMRGVPENSSSSISRRSCLTLLKTIYE